MSNTLCEPRGLESVTQTHVPCRVVITRHGHSQVFLIDDGCALHLPGFQIPGGERAAPQLVRRIRESWNIQSVCLFRARSADSRTRLYVLESVEAAGDQQVSGKWIPADRIPQTLLVDADREALDIALSETEKFKDRKFGSNFSYPGWIDELKSWIETVIAPCALHLHPRWDQYAMGPDFCLMRWETNGPSLWFKAVGKRCLKEYSITAKLAQLSSRHLPQVIAFHSEWRGWLMFEAGGVDLEKTADPEAWTCTARSLADLELESAGHADSLLAAGCRDLRLESLDRSIARWLARMRELMAEQTVRSPAALSSDALEVLAEFLHLACERLSATAVKDTLNHGDLNPGNILVGPEHAVILDWAEASVSHPFFTLEYLLAIARRLHAHNERLYRSVEESYLARWKEVYAPTTLAEIRRWTPLLAMFAFSLSCSQFEEDEDDLSPDMRKLLRSMARRMYAFMTEAS